MHFRLSREIAILAVACWAAACSAQGSTARNPAKLQPSVIQGPLVSPTPGMFYRLAFVGYELDGTAHLDAPKGTNSCCDEIRAGWMVTRGGFWVAVDTVAELFHPTPGETSIHADGPFHVRVDSGGRAVAGLDTLIYESVLTPNVLPPTAFIGLRRGDTITFRSGGGGLYHARSVHVRIYVRIRSESPHP